MEIKSHTRSRRSPKQVTRRVSRGHPGRCSAANTPAVTSQRTSAPQSKTNKKIKRTKCRAFRQMGEQTLRLNFAPRPKWSVGGVHRLPSSNKSVFFSINGSFAGGHSSSADLSDARHRFDVDYKLVWECLAGRWSGGPAEGGWVGGWSAGGRQCGDFKRPPTHQDCTLARPGGWLAVFFSPTTDPQVYQCM